MQGGEQRWLSGGAAAGTARAGAGLWMQEGEASPCTGPGGAAPSMGFLGAPPEKPSSS